VFLRNVGVLRQSLQVKIGMPGTMRAVQAALPPDVLEIPEYKHLTFQSMN